MHLVQVGVTCSVPHHREMTKQPKQPKVISASGYLFRIEGGRRVWLSVPPQEWQQANGIECPATPGAR